MLHSNHAFPHFTLNPRSPFTVILSIPLIFLSPVLQAETAILLEDDFSTLRPGLFFDVVGAHAEYHYLPICAGQGNWAVTAYSSKSESQRAWRVGRDDRGPYFGQSYTNTQKHTHPMVVAGDPQWSDYEVTVRLQPESLDGRSGFAFRYRNDRRYYFFGVEGQRVVLRMVRDESAFRVPIEPILAESACEWAPGDILEARVTVNGSRIRALLKDVEFDLEDSTYPTGRVALLSDIPTRYRHVLVTTSQNTKSEIDARIQARMEDERQLQESNPKPILWKRVSTAGFGVGRNLRFGDLNGDGEIDVLVGQVNAHGAKDANSELSCLTAITFDGEQLWRVGLADEWRNALTNDVAFQIHDLDGDGRNEVIYCMNQELVVADGATGETKYKTPTPESPPNSRPGYNRFDRILGDALFFCDLRGQGRDGDIVLKDRYQHFWVFDERLRLQWRRECNTGHYPYACDIDSDGNDELMICYSLYDGDGTRLWTLEDQVTDHADGVAITRFRDGAPLELLCAASDEGIFFADTNGAILKHHRFGHVQNPTIADFRPDLPGLESISINFWGNQGIVHVFDSSHNPILDFEPCQHGSMCLPINWTGQPGEFFVLSPNVTEGGMFDGWGRKVVAFPADGHPDLCNAVLDLTGDCRDEVVVWDPYEIWVYTQDDNPKPGALYKPTRNPLHNYSNYQATVSTPGWSTTN